MPRFARECTESVCFATVCGEELACGDYHLLPRTKPAILGVRVAGVRGRTSGGVGSLQRAENEVLLPLHRRQGTI